MLTRNYYNKRFLVENVNFPSAGTIPGLWWLFFHYTREILATQKFGLLSSKRTPLRRRSTYTAELEDTKRHWQYSSGYSVTIVLNKNKNLGYHFVLIIQYLLHYSNLLLRFILLKDHIIVTLLLLWRLLLTTVKVFNSQTGSRKPHRLRILWITNRYIM